MSTTIVIIAGREPLHRVTVPQSVAVQCVAVAHQLESKFRSSRREDSGDVSLSDNDNDDDNNDEGKGFILEDVMHPIVSSGSGDSGGGDGSGDSSGDSSGSGGAPACSSVELVLDAGKALTDLVIRFLLHHQDTPYNSPVFPIKSIPGAVFADEFDNVSTPPTHTRVSLHTRHLFRKLLSAAAQNRLKLCLDAFGCPRLG